MRVRAFTGPSRLTEREGAWVSEQVAKLAFADEIRTGAAKGVDAIAAQVSLDRHPRAHHVVYVPSAPHHKSVVKYMGAHGATIVNTPPKPTQASAYRIRNRMMVEGATELIAFLLAPTFYRSGEWMTVRLAREAGCRIMGLVIEEDTVVL